MTKRTAKSITQQFNLSLVSTPLMEVSQDKQKELRLALIELLTNAACPADETQDNRGDNHEPQTNS
jgi:anti-sigma regulatory factor (Ser/Thr protein kinase)